MEHEVGRRLYGIHTDQYMYVVGHSPNSEQFMSLLRYNACDVFIQFIFPCLYQTNPVLYSEHVMNIYLCVCICHVFYLCPTDNGLYALSFSIDIVVLRTMYATSLLLLILPVRALISIENQPAISGVARRASMLFLIIVRPHLRQPACGRRGKRLPAFPAQPCRRSRLRRRSRIRSR